MKLSDFSYYLPEELIAQTPLTNRSASRLLVMDRKTGAYEDKHFEDILDYFQPGDCLIANDSRVIPARLQAKRPTGGAVEIFLLRPYGEDRWECLVKPGRNAREGQILLLGDLTATVESVTEEGNRVIAFTCAEGDVTDKLKALGEVPLPPYIHEKLADAEQELADAEKDVEKELSDAEAELADARAELDDGWKEYEDGKLEFEQEIADAEQEIADGEKELADALVELTDGEKEYKDGLADTVRWQ